MSEADAGVRSELEELRAALRRVEAERDELRGALARACRERDRIERSSIWRATAPLRSAIDQARAVRRMAMHAVRVAARKTGCGWLVGRFEERAAYRRWIAAAALTPADRRLIAAHVARFSARPLISVIMPVHDTPEPILREALRSVRAQLYPDWELCIADDASPAPHVRRVLDAASQEDPRIRWVKRERNGNISAATNTALDMARGEFAVLLDHDDCLAEHALYEVAALLNECPQADIVFSDEDRFDGDGPPNAARRHSHYFKTEWDPDLILGHNMVCHLGAYRLDLLRRIGGLREGYEGSQDYDLILRAAAATTPERICHLPAILYHWRLRRGESFSETQLARCVDAARRAIAEHLGTRPGSRGAEVLPHPRHPSYHRVRWSLPDPAPLASILVPTRDRAGLLRRCADGVLRRTDYPAIEFIVLDNDSSDPETSALFEELRQDPRVRILAAPGAFNYSALNNRGAREANGDVLLLLNNDIDVLDGGWLREMVSQAMRPDVGTVGARLLYTDHSVQHAGVVLGVGVFDGGPGVASHFGWHEAPGEVGYAAHSVLTRTVCASTGACLAVRRSTYLEVGGLDEVNLPIAFNDVDFCLRVRERGYRNIWTPFAELLHLESASRGAEDTPEKQTRFNREARYMRDRWGRLLDHDPYFNENFSRTDHRCRPAIPPRRTPPWRRAGLG